MNTETENTCPLSHIIENLHLSTLILISSAIEEMENAMIQCDTIVDSQDAGSENNKNASVIFEVQEVAAICKTAQNILISAMCGFEGTTSV